MTISIVISCRYYVRIDTSKSVLQIAFQKLDMSFFSHRGLRGKGGAFWG